IKGGGVEVGLRVVGGAADQDGLAGAAEEEVGAAAANQDAAVGAGDERVVAAAAEDVLDRDPAGARVGDASQVGGGAGLEIDGHVGGVGGVVQRVAARAADNGQRRGGHESL